MGKAYIFGQERKFQVRHYFQAYLGKALDLLTNEPNGRTGLFSLRQISVMVIGNGKAVPNNITLFDKESQVN